MSTIITAPEKLPEDYAPSVFLAGSIEQGKAENWQARVMLAIGDLDITILNPRRKNWDPTWPQTPDFPPFREQVEWELNALDDTTHILFYFQPGTMSPISLLELGLYVDGDKAIVVCPKDFWRYGNVAIICEMYGIPLYHNLPGGIHRLRNRLTRATLG